MLAAVCFVAYVVSLVSIATAGGMLLAVVSSSRPQKLHVPNAT